MVLSRGRVVDKECRESVGMSAIRLVCTSERAYGRGMSWETRGNGLVRW